MQLRLEKRLNHGVSFLANYTWSKSLDLDSGGAGSDENQDATNIAADRGLSDFDVRHRFVSSASWELPLLRRNRWFGGWQTNTIATFQTGFPLNITAADTSGAGSFTVLRANRVGDGNLPRDERTITRYFDTTAFQAPRPGTFGTSGRNVIIGPGINNWSLSVLKNTQLRESVNLQLRGEAFNAFNHSQFFAPGSSVSTPALIWTHLERAYSAEYPGWTEAGFLRNTNHETNSTGFGHSGSAALVRGAIRCRGDRRTPAGIAAALAAGQGGKRVVIVEQAPVLGGMLSSGVSRADDAVLQANSGVFEEFRQRIAKYHRTVLADDPVVREHLAKPRVRHSVSDGQAWEAKTGLASTRRWSPRSRRYRFSFDRCRSLRKCATGASLPLPRRTTRGRSTSMRGRFLHPRDV